MSGSAQSTIPQLLLHLIPGVSLWCPGGNRHFRWNISCQCADHLQLGTLLYVGSGRWLSLRATWVTVEGKPPEWYRGYWRGLVTDLKTLFRRVVLRRSW